ncbi:nucleoside recognition protein [Haloglomus litoreum]|uniref:nucleoside recognition protein n=1 Tax=Haloglomus litoreum TaxID=3034026 RepID=UPI0023E8BDEF|nr:nucleoside recognition protein [Haloglomus sp. DT116]
MVAEPVALAGEVLATVLPRVAKIALFIGVGVALADLLVSAGLLQRVTGLSRRLTGPANLPDEAGTAIVTTAASTTAGYGMLAEYRDEGRMDDRATLVAVTINTFFGFVQHIPTFYAPVLIPILGLRVGLAYVASRALVALAITCTGVLAGRLLLDPPERPATADEGADASGDPVEADGGESTGRGPSDGAVDGRMDDVPDSTRGKLVGAARSGAGKVRDILPRLAVVYALVVLLTRFYDPSNLTALAGPLSGTTGLPGAAVPVIAVFALDTTNGALVLAPLVRDGTFGVRAAVATMLIGGIVSFAVSTFKRSIPFQYGIWGAEFGSKVVAVNTALKVVWIAMAVAVVLYAPLPL